MEDARKFAATLGFGLIGEAPVVANQSNIVAFERPDAFDVPQARHKLGGISRSTLYRLLKRGKLSRLTDTRKVLITRRSIERYLAVRGVTGGAPWLDDYCAGGDSPPAARFIHPTVHGP